MEDDAMDPRSVSRTIRWPFIIALGGLAIALSGVVFLFRPVPSASAAEGPHVSIVEPDPNKAETWKFDPAEITVKAGTTVVWDWKGRDKHSASADDGSFDSGVKQGAGQRWEHRFDAPGDYAYSCTPHPFMTGRVKVTP
jgi:plastocyanin